MRSRKISLEIVTVLTIVVIGIFTLAPQVQIWFQQRQQIADLTVQVAKAKAELANMKVERKRWEDPVYIRSQARDRLYYVLPGEVSYLVMDANGINTSDVSGTMGAKLAAQRNSNEISTSIMRTKKNWVNSVMQSVIRAGLEEPVVPSATDKVGSK
jgi:cell division protein FtsB